MKTKDEQYDKTIQMIEQELSDIETMLDRYNEYCQMDETERRQKLILDGTPYANTSYVYMTVDESFTKVLCLMDLVIEIYPPSDTLFKDSLTKANVINRTLCWLDNVRTAVDRDYMNFLVAVDDVMILS